MGHETYQGLEVLEMTFQVVPQNVKYVLELYMKWFQAWK
jgi:hypothetical protein